ncbi:Hypothetical protein R9X50_00553400 [Acrodontium crateriforme]|uniref:Protein phosphatase methylesterase 1 n=1 Tax=Acrodontium crateriforme TaxID=150365 RepID=A0AAQ3RD92_9PEZI|nr:Hypothetical protein R9X50_00553400 [Acrodontium crateriforme]
MSHLFRASLETAQSPSRPKPTPIAVTPLDFDDQSSSDSSASSADSFASINTIRPSSAEPPAPPSHWTNYYAQELFLSQDNDDQRARYHVYITPPSDPKKGPLFICHHGAGVTGLSFAVFARHIRKRLPHAGVLSLEARAHGSTVTGSKSGEAIVDFSLETLAADALSMISLTQQKMGWSTLPPVVLIGHSLGGAITTRIAASPPPHLLTALVGNCVVDVVEGSAVEALGHMRTYLSSRPSKFPTTDAAIQWHLHSRTIRSKESAEASVPALLRSTMPGEFQTSYTWLTDLQATSPWWPDWFTNMSTSFLAGRCAKLLILAGTDRLDKTLMIGQMQGKFQLVVLPEAGHFVQEDVPERMAGLLADFFTRNDRSQMVLPPKVADLIAQGKKV